MALGALGAFSASPALPFPLPFAAGPSPVGTPSAAVGAAFLAGTLAEALTGVGAAEGLLAEVALATGVTSFLPTAGGLAAEGTAAADVPV